MATAVTTSQVYHRKEPKASGIYYASIPSNTTLTVSVYNDEWWSCTYKGLAGYVSRDYTNPGRGSSGGTNPGGGTQSGTIQGSNVNVRATPSTSASIKAVVNTGCVVNGNPSETYTANGYTWYRLTSTAWSGDGYVASNYVSFTGSGTGGGTYLGKDGWVSCNSAGLNVRSSAGGNLLNYKLEDGHMINVQQEQTSGGTLYFRVKDEQGRTNGWVDSGFIVWTGITPPAVGTRITFNKNAAIAFARQFAANDTGTDAYCKGFSAYGNDCVNFVSQCLWAGGLPMTFGANWSYPWNFTKPYAPASSSEAWRLTTKLRNFLLERGWATEFTNASSVQPGDIALTFNTVDDIPHVCFVTRVSGGSIYVCGHTTNQNDQLRNVAGSRYLRVNSQITTAAGDRWYYGFSSKDDWNSAFQDYGGQASTFQSGGTYAGVGNMKRRLQYLGYTVGAINDTYDATTLAAVKKFQTDAGITNNNGSVGNMTKAKLYRPKGKLK